MLESAREETQSYPKARERYNFNLSIFLLGISIRASLKFKIRPSHTPAGEGVQINLSSLKKNPALTRSE